MNQDCDFRESHPGLISHQSCSSHLESPPFTGPGRELSPPALGEESAALGGSHWERQIRLERHWDTTNSARQCHHRHPQRGGNTLQNQTKSEQVRFWNLGDSTSHQQTAPLYRPDTPVHWNSVRESSRPLPTQQQLLQLFPAFPEP